MTTEYRHRTPRERRALESAQVAIARAQAHAAAGEAEPAAPVPATTPDVPPTVTSDEPTSSAAAWRHRCRQIREEIDAERAGYRETA